MRRILVIAALVLFSIGLAEGRQAWEYAVLKTDVAAVEMRGSVSLRMAGELYRAGASRAEFMDYLNPVAEELGVEFEGRALEIDIVSHLGSQGWELISVTSYIDRGTMTTTYWFKRPRTLE